MSVRICYRVRGLVPVLRPSTLVWVRGLGDGLRLEGEGVGRVRMLDGLGS